MALAAVPADDGSVEPESFFSFKGMKAAGDFPALPALGDHMKFELVAECVGEPHLTSMSDGHRRRLVGMKVISVQPGEITEAPVDPQLRLDEDVFVLGDEPDDDDA